MPPSGSGTGLSITNPLVLYRSLVATNRIKPDPAQHRLALRLQKLYEELKDYEPRIEYSHRLQQLSQTISAAQQNNETANEPSTLGTRGIWTSLLAQKEKRDSLALTRVLTSHDAAMQLQSPKGLMLHGEVGTGKSMLIDLFADSLPSRKKRRYHFNTFMLDTISRLEALRRSRALSNNRAGGLGGDDYSLLTLARDLIHTSPILFLDEFQLPDRAASKILSNLMTSFFQLGGVLIATSNRMPEELAKAAGMEFARPVSRFSRLGWQLGFGGGSVRRDDGAGQKGEFAQFLEVLRARCEVWEMEGKRDYRRLAGEEDGSVNSVAVASQTSSGVSSGNGVAGNAPDEKDTAIAASSDATRVPRHYLLQPPLDASPEEQTAFEDALDTFLSAATSSPTPIPWAPTTLTVYGRQFPIPRQHNGTAFFTFDDLCGATLGPADYITLASTFHTLILAGVPILTFLQKNEARRFITLLDALYESRCRLLLTAAAGPDDIFFPEPSTTSASGIPENQGERADTHLAHDAVHPETFSEIYQDLNSPFRPNISSYSPPSSPSLSEDALEDDPPSRFRRPGSSFTDERKLAIGGVEKSNVVPDFANIGGLTGEDERFAVRRARSRVWEMCSGRWWGRARGEGAGMRGLEGAGDGVAGWWRPLPVESRHWEHGGRREESVKTQGRASGADDEEGPGKSGEEALSDVRSLGDSPEAVDTPEGLFRHGASPFRTASEPPPKIGWSHVWGTVKWGKKAGAWGKGVEGLGERKKTKGKETGGNE